MSCMRAHRYADALAFYRDQVLSAGGGEVGQEARVMSALCLENLDRPREAIDLLEFVVTNGSRRWALIAACNLLRLQVEQGNLEAADVVLDELGKRFDQADFRKLIPDDFGERIVEKCSPTLLQVYFAPAPAPMVRKVERARTVQRIFGGRPEVRYRVLWNSVLAYHFADQTDRALQAAEELLDKGEFRNAVGWSVSKEQGAYAEVMDHYCWLQRTSGHANLALARIDKELFKKPELPSPAMGFLFLPRAHRRIALGQWDQAEKDLETFFSLAGEGRGSYEVPSAGLILGFLRERRGDKVGALQAWRSGHCATGNRAPKTDPLWTVSPDVKNTSLLHFLILGSLTGALSDLWAELMLQVLMERAESNLPGVVVQEAKKLVPRTLMRDMWLTPRRRTCARHLAFQDVTFAESQRIPWLLAPYESIRQAVFPGDLSADQDQVLWQLVSELHKAYTTEKVSMFQLGALLLTWKGNTGLLGWQGVAANLPGSLRGPLAYVIGRRYQQLKKPKEAESFYRTALKDALADSALHRLAKGVLDRKEYESALPDAQTPNVNQRRFAPIEEKEYDKAIAEFTKAIGIRPTDPRGFLGRGLAHYNKKAYDEAIADYTQAIRVRSNLPLPYSLRGRAYYETDQFEQAMADFTESIRLDPKVPDNYYRRGWIHKRNKDYDHALADYRRTLVLDPNNAYASNSLAWLLATCPEDSLRDGKKAVQHATKACAVQKKANHLGTLAAAHAESGDFKEAVNRQKEAIELGYDSSKETEQARQRLKLYEECKAYREE